MNERVTPNSIKSAIVAMKESADLLQLVARQVHEDLSVTPLSRIAVSSSLYQLARRMESYSTYLSSELAESGSLTTKRNPL